MRWSNNDSGLSAKRSVLCTLSAKRSVFCTLSAKRSVLCTLTALAVCLVSCKTTQLPPLDDAYYWPEKNTPIIQNTQSNQQSSIINQQSTINNQKSPIIEYLNVQDTTVTVRIKR